MAIERELKLRLDSETEVRAIESALGRMPLRVEHQRNVFVDTPDRRLMAAGWVCRLRRGGGVWELTGKDRGRTEGAVATRTEIAAILDGALAAGLDARPLQRGERLRLEDVFPAPAERRERFAALVRLVEDNGLEVLGGFDNERRTYAFTAGGCTSHLELDRTELGPGDVEYELEVELDPEHERGVSAAVLELLASLGISGKLSESKFIRFARRAGILAR
ncbi:MAG: CYTH domain-containing protein [Candidatus Schekmanbacteria bacterium]|nr:CYTH domain-containing protein [Candidatus Schekmanbacteria bacterium]